jgi:hypothetical protein
VRHNNKEQKSIAILIFYFGKLPWYFDYFIHSCKFNPSVNFIIITDDNTYLKEVPINVTLQFKKFTEISKVATQRLHFPIKIENPYKLCDFKPAFAFLFPELVTGYDFWGHGDLDVIYGNIRKFITGEMLNQFDLISVRHDYITGHFALYRNCNKMNELFLQTKDYKKVFTEGRNFCFDETNYAFEAFTNGVPYDQISTEIESMTHLVKRLAAKKYLRAYFDFHIIEGLPGKLKWDRGKLTYKDKFEAMMYHLIALKTIYHPKESPTKIPDRFTISPTRIYHKQIS